MCTGEADQAAPGACPTGCTTSDDCALNNSCSIAGNCEPILCELSGNQGEVVNCPLHLVRDDVAFLPAVQFQLTLDYDNTKVAVDSMEVCGELDAPFNLACTIGGDECDLLGDPAVYCGPSTLTCSKCTAYAPGANDAELSGGHTVVTCEKPPANCGTGEFSMLFWGSQSEPINDAYVDAGVVTGTSEFIVVKFSLLVDVPAGTNVSIGPDDFVAADAQAQGLVLRVAHSSAPNPDHFVATGLPLP